MYKLKHARNCKRLLHTERKNANYLLIKERMFQKAETRKLDHSRIELWRRFEKRELMLRERGEPSTTKVYIWVKLKWQIMSSSRIHCVFALKYVRWKIGAVKINENFFICDYMNNGNDMVPVSCTSLGKITEEKIIPSSYLT
jgi:hypothetical protein